MLLILAVVLAFYFAKESWKNKTLVLELQSELSWYRAQFGFVPNEVDIVEWNNEQNRLAALAKNSKKEEHHWINGNPVPNVYLAGKMGLREDKGTFRVHEDRIEFEGSKRTIFIKFISLSKIFQKGENLVFVGSDNRKWVFESFHLKKYGVTEEFLNRLLFGS